MYPPQTSLIPVTVALARFAENNGFSSLYPYWYLGSTPFRFLTGPVTPWLLVGVRKLFSDASLFSLSIFLVGAGILLGSLGWGILAAKISKRKALGVAVGGLTLLLPFRLLSSFALNEVSLQLARSLLPFVLICFFWLFEKPRGRQKAVAVLATTFLLLTHTGILPALLIGIAALIFATGFKKGKFKKIARHIRLSFWVLLVSLALATFWYTPSFWQTLLLNPSIGGTSGWKAIFRLFELLRGLVPLVLAIFIVYFSGRVKSRLLLFSLIWTLTFAFLTLFRFIGDPAFWLDWSSWLAQIEIGAAFLVGMAISRFGLKPNLSLLAGLALFLASFLFTRQVYYLLRKPALITQRMPPVVASLEKLQEISGNKTVFLSGSTVFWANALYDISQVRGGRDEVAVHPTWDQASYELREGAGWEDSQRWVRELNIAFVLVHEPTSSEFYHDFKNTEKWEEFGELVWQEDGDRIYQVKK